MSSTPDLSTLLAQFEQAIETDQQIAAIRALGRTRSPEILPYLIRAFGFNRPAVADAALAEVLRCGSVAVMPLLENIDDYNYGARAYSVRALATLADPRALPYLLQVIRTDFAPSVKRAATRGLGAVALAADPPLHPDVLITLNTCLQDSDWAVRYAAVCALADLQTHPEPEVRRAVAQAIQVAHRDDDPLIQIKVQVSCGSAESKDNSMGSSAADSTRSES